MLKAFRFADSYQRGTNLRAWLFRILNTSAINRYRKQASHPMTTSLPEGEEFYLYNRIRDLSGQELTMGAEEEVLSKYLDEDVYKALSDLPLIDRRRQCRGGRYRRQREGPCRAQEARARACSGSQSTPIHRRFHQR